MDWLIRHSLVPYGLAIHSAPSGKHLRDRSNGNNLGVVMRMAERPQLWPNPRVVMVGDSTVVTGHDPDEKALVNHVRFRIEASRMVPKPVQLIEFAAAGLPARDASILIAKALGLGVDLVVYAVTPRIICDDMAGIRVTDAASWILDADVRRTLGMDYVFENHGTTYLLRALVLTHWDLFRFRNEIRMWIQWQRYRLPKEWHPGTPPRAYPPDSLFAPVKRTGPLWTYRKCSYDEANPNLRALRRIVEMCGETGRCLIYHGPLNPTALHQFESGMVAQFDLLVRSWTAEHDVPYRNYKSSVGNGGFAKPKARGGERVIDAVHMNPRGRWQLAGLIAADASRLLATHLTNSGDVPLASTAHEPTGG